MTEQQIKDGYARLDDALAPPLDLEQRLERRVAARRRHRRTTVAGVTTLGVLAVGGTVVALAGGEDGTGPTVASDPGSAPESTLVLTRPDGSTYAFEDITVSCDSDGSRIQASSPRHFTDGRATPPLVEIAGIVTKLEGGRTLDLPIDGPGDSDTYPLTLFIADSQGTPRGNEVSSPETASSGTVRVLRAECLPTPVLEVEVDAVLGSEVEQQPLRLTGDLH